MQDIPEDAPEIPLTVYYRGYTEDFLPIVRLHHHHPGTQVVESEGGMHQLHENTRSISMVSKPFLSRIFVVKSA